MSNDRPTGLPLGRVIEDITGFTGPISEFVSGPEPDVPVAREIHQAVRAQCDSYSNAPSWFTNQTGGFQVGVGLVCDEYLDSQGSGPPVVSAPGAIDIAQQYSGQEFPDGLRINLSIAPGPGVCYRGYVVNFVNESQGIINLTLTRCDGSTITTNTSAFEIISVGCCAGGSDPPPTPDPVINPNPNPRPDPGLDPEDEPFEREPGQPVLPMPEIPNPFGDPVRLPNLPLPPLFGTENEGGLGNPNAGPPVTPGDPQDGNGTDGDDDDFGEPPEGHIWVGFVVEISDQGVSEGLQPNSPPEPIYRSATGNYRAKYDIEGETVYSSPREIRQRMSAYFLDLPGLTLTGARVNVPSNDSYVVTPLSQPVTEEGEPQQV